MTFPGVQEAYVQGRFCGPNTYVVVQPQPLGGDKYLNAQGVWDIVDNAAIFDCPNKAVEAKRKADAESKGPITIGRGRRK